MNRREAIHFAGAMACGLATRSQAQPLPAVVAGVRIVDPKIARTATELSRTVSPSYLVNHAIRIFLFGSLAGRAWRQKFDEEVLYLACSSMTLTDRFAGDLPFEIQGAQAAKKFGGEDLRRGKGCDHLGWHSLHTLRIGQFNSQRSPWLATGRAPMCLDRSLRGGKKLSG